MIDPKTTVGAVHLTVADLERSLDVLRAARSGSRRSSGRGPGVARVGRARAARRSSRSPARGRADGYTGLFHFALLVPTRPELARWLAHAARDRVALTGLSDHFVSEAIYLRDPDGHGIEIYADRPRETWEGTSASG